ncbi:hypothetical protein [Halosimplex pelagicum]|uniref:Uncharacterized protein n=1 Tax=Halosimplex pelagicum TaxID=869886 RepID=A0A7D5P929_9EURY|nr:hypothetical protein [Halosimplex pelagicum]QLH82301.1 hypothetical protein HZS54_12060 [Halosimplex pelagicum]
MSEHPKDWDSAPIRAENIADQPDEARGWINTETGEVVIRQPLHREDENLPAFGVYFYLEVSKSTGLGTNRSLLFRDDEPEQADERVHKWLEDAETPTDPDRFDTALDPIAIRREELSHVASLEDWAHLTGAEYYLSEKIGTRKQSSGPVAIFNGSSRRGEGAYVALAEENGPRGRKFASVGYQPSGYYTTDQSLSRAPFEVESPSVEFDHDTIRISGADGSTAITITAQTDNPSHSLDDN